MKDKLLIIGASGHGAVVADVAINMSKWNYIAFLDDNTTIRSTIGLDVIGSVKEYQKFIEDYDLFVGIGNNRTRESIQQKLVMAGASIPTLIHPKAVLGHQVTVQDGTVIMAGAIINCNTKIGYGCIINTGATIDHDNNIGDFVHISPGVHTAGAVQVETRTWLGIGSVVSNNLCITSDCIIGAGAVVVDNIIESGTYVGIPARRI